MQIMVKAATPRIRRTTADIRNILGVIKNNLLLLAVLTAALCLLVPSAGIALEACISPLLALRMLIISLNFDAKAVQIVFRKPGRQLWATALVYGLMSLAGWLTGRAFFGNGPLAAGQRLVGMLPTDVSAPLVVLLALGNVALAAVLTVMNTALLPFIIPFLFLWMTGIELKVPVLAVVTGLVLIAVVLSVIGVWLQTRSLEGLSRFDFAWHAGGRDLPHGRDQPKRNGGLLPDEMRRLTTLEDENSRLKKIVADLTLDREMLQDVIRRNGWFAPPVQGSPDDVQDCIDVSGLSRVSWISSKAMMRSARAVPN